MRTAQNSIRQTSSQLPNHYFFLPLRLKCVADAAEAAKAIAPGVDAATQEGKVVGAVVVADLAIAKQTENVQAGVAN